MRRLDFVLLTALPLCRARQHGFSIHDDLLAYPQFEVVFSDTYISELDAEALLESAGSSHATYSTDPPSATELTNHVRRSAPDDAAPHDGSIDEADDGIARVSETYEIMHLPPEKYLCAVPVLAPAPALNETATELARAEEARELSRASAHGWELMSDMEGTCLYFVSGWWSYSFCYGNEIVQFHALPSAGKGTAPVRDPHTQEYVLGRVDAGQHNHQLKKREGQQAQQQQKPLGDVGQHGAAEGSPASPPKTELAIKGDRRYLVERLEGGTVCDLTKRERTIELQYHCNPNTKVPRIGWVKEITTCTYLMVIDTPRLCEDVAFQPPKETRAHSISCRVIVGSEEDVAAWHRRKTIEAAGLLGVQAATQQQNLRPVGSGQGQGRSPHAGVTVGGVVVGGRQTIGLRDDGEPVVQLSHPRGYVPGKKITEPLVEVIATGKSREEGGEIVVLADEELKKMELDPRMVEDLWKELQHIAGDKAWRLEVVEIPGEVAEIRGIIDADVDSDDENGSAEKGDGKATKGKDGKATKGKDEKAAKGDGSKAGGDEGSEEKFFKEEL